MKKRVIFILILLVLVLPNFQPICMAIETNETGTEISILDNGKYEENVTYELDNQGTLTIEEPTTKVNKNGVEFYEISNENQLAYVSQMAGEWLNKNYILVQDIKLNDRNIEYNTETGELITNANYLQEWKPIGANGEKYTGIFDGNNHKISGVYISNKEQDGENEGKIGTRFIWYIWWSN